MCSVRSIGSGNRRGTRKHMGTSSRDGSTNHPPTLHNRHQLTFSAFTRPACSPFLSAPCRSTSFSSSATRRRCLLATAQSSTHAAAQPQVRVVAVVGCFAASTIQGNFGSGVCGGAKLLKYDDHHHDLEGETAIGCVRLSPPM